jgi:acyl-CoA thioesterase-1
VCHQHQSGPLALVERNQQIQYVRSVDAIEVPGGLVGHQNGRLRHERPGQRHALLLAAGELHRIVIQAIAQANAFKQRASAGDSGGDFAARKLVRQQDVFFGGQGGEQLVTLEHESDLAAADQRQPVFLQARNIDAVYDDGPRSSRVETGEQTEQRALSTSGGTHDGDELAGRNIEVDAAEDFNAMAPAVEAFGKVPGGENGHFFYYGGWDSMILKYLIIGVLALAPAHAQISRKVLVVFGDSLSAGYGLAAGQSFPDDIQRTLDKEGYAWQVKNLGISGDTTEGGVSRIQSAVRLKPAVVLLELGGNDGLRGLPLKVTRKNLETMIVAFQQAGAKVVLAGMTLPPNYGPDYIKSFESIYKDLAAEYKLKLIPFLLSDIMTPDLRYLQRDGIHPTAEGAEIVAGTVLKVVKPLLK